MAIYEISGQRFEVDDSVQGEQLTQTLMQISEQMGAAQQSVSPSQAMRQQGAAQLAQQQQAMAQEDQLTPEQKTVMSLPVFGGDFAQLEEIGAAPELGEFSTRGFKTSLAANLISSDLELAQSLAQQIPGSTFSRDEEGNIIATMPSGGSFFLNKPGFSGQDIAKFTTRALAFTPAGRGLTGIALPTLAKSAGQSAVTEAGLQAVESGLGGEFTPADIGVAGVAAPLGQVAGTKIAQGLQRRAADKALKEAAPTTSALKETARGIYKQIDEIGGVIPEDKAGGLFADIEGTLRREGFNKRINPEIRGLFDEIRELSNSSLSVSQLDTLRKVAQNAAGSQDKSTARLGGIAIQKIDDFMDDFPESEIGGEQVGALYKQARTLWRQASKSELLEQAVEKAKNQASGFENGIRVQFRSILNNPKKAKGFTGDELDAMKAVVRGGKAENILKALGKFGFTEGQATNMLLGSLGVAGGAAIGGGAGAVAVPLAGQTARIAAQKLTSSNAKLAQSIVRAGKDGRRIAMEYVRNVPKSERSVEELTGILLESGADISKMSGAANPLFSNAALAASLILTAKPAIDQQQDAATNDQ